MKANQSVSAILHWRLSEEGGRSALPTGLRYVTVARYFDANGKLTGHEYSTVIESPLPLNRSQNLTVTLSVLIPENAPETLLSAGSRFELLEGSKIVATGQVQPKVALTTPHEHWQRLEPVLTGN